MEPILVKKERQNDLPADPEAVWRLLGMAVKAGQAVSGSEAAENALRRKKARLVLLAVDSSDNTRRKFIPPDRPPTIPVIQFGSKAELGHWTGHQERAVAAILDQGFADRLCQLVTACQQAEANKLAVASQLAAAAVQAGSKNEQEQIEHEIDVGG
jgi:ribosomal protein L7Ae-like RNA K-turn-binding protein